jgi:DNA-binding transcriptional regulator PaaX
MTMSEPILTEDAGQVLPGGSCWITVGAISVKITDDTEIVTVKLFVKGREAEDEALLDECWAFHAWADDYRKTYPDEEAGVA